MINLLTTNDEKKLLILGHFETNNHSPITLVKIKEFTELSTFKSVNLLDELTEELSRFQFNCSIENNNNKEFTSFGINTEVINQYRLLLLKQSPYFKIFMFYFLNGKNFNLLTQSLSISQSNAYILVKNLNGILKPYDIKIHNKKLVGDERQIRLKTFEMFNFYFKGMEFPFEEALFKKIEPLIFELSKAIPMNKTPNLILKLRIFLAINYLRINQNFTIEPSADRNFNIENSLELKRLFKVWENRLLRMSQTELNNLIFYSEYQYLLEFLFSETIINYDTILDNVEIPEIVVERSNEFLKLLINMNYLEINSLNYYKLEKKCYSIFFKRFFYSYQIDSFYDKTSYEQYSELYPNVSGVIMTYLELIEQNDFSNPENILLYYDLLFALLTLLPVSTFEAPIHICVDFSRGDSYTEHIKNNIRSFNSLEIHFDDIITDETSLYISDFATYEYRIPQVIWRNPPTTNDWKILGNTLIALKQER
ncbi:helix-turn-helix domain-containing protein [Vagococcus sp. PNs007]|uniref:Helix-turn-helix domain-containing protein n=1 Tax=Vagococcus proximus TaxID=2991417 RepID=A0ABT5WZ02_9ENTE|nr:helix-turn-helix domain-containing protein [Vagococcus proximus]